MLFKMSHSVDFTEADSHTSEPGSQSLLTETDSQTSEPGSPSLLTGLTTPSNKSTMTSEEKVYDRLSKILYHVTPSEGQISIRFSSKELYQRFTHALNKELHPKQINDTRATYQTHIQGKWCSLTTDEKAISLYITGPARKQWRETVFIRLVIHLYRQYVQGTDDLINDSQISQTSTPARTEQNFISPFMSPVTTPANLSDTEYEIASVSEISEQIKGLQTISKHLQEQLTSVNTKLDILLQKALDLAPISTINGSLEGEVQHVTINTTVEDEPQIIPGSATYRDVATRKPTGNPVQNTTLIGTNTKNDNQITDSRGNKAPTRNQASNRAPAADQGKSNKDQNVNQRSSVSASQANPSRGLSSTVQRKGNKVLILSDSILSGVNRKGLSHNVECQPYSGAKIVTVHEKVHLFDLSKFSDIVIYVGGNDSSSNTDIELFEEKYEQLIQHIKNKNPSCELHLCTSCPRGDTDVEDVNDVIKRLCEVHKVKCIDTNSGFYDKNQQLRSHFYKPRDNVHLSRSGIKRVLGLINETLYIVENFEKCVYPVTPQEKKSTIPTTPGSHRRAQYPRPDSVDREERPSQNHENNYRYMGRRRLGYPQLSETDISRCLKCGLTNHSTDSCRHKTQVKCFNCKLYGHKDSSGLCRQK